MGNNKDKSNKIIETIDKVVILKYLLDDNFINNNSPENFAISTDWDNYQELLKKRIGYSLPEISEKLQKQNRNEINDLDINNIYSVSKLSKAVSGSIALQAVIYALQEALRRLYYESDWMLRSFNNNFTDIRYQSWVKLNNLFLYSIKSLRDDLNFISFDNGQLIANPVQKNDLKKIQKKQPVKKYFYDYVDEWDIEEVNCIWDSLQLVKMVLQGTIELFPDNNEYAETLTEISNTYKVCLEFEKEFPSMVMTANNLMILSVAPKEVNFTEITLNPIFLESTAKREGSNNKDNKDLIYLIKSTDVSQGLVTGIVLEPGDENNRDLQQQYITSEVIEKAMVNYMENYQAFGLMHKEFNESQGSQNPDFRLIENYITLQDLTLNNEQIKKGSWVQTWKILNEDIKKKTMEGTYNGFSIGGFAIVEPG